ETSPWLARQLRGSKGPRNGHASKLPQIISSDWKPSIGRPPVGKIQRRKKLKGLVEGAKNMGASSAGPFYRGPPCQSWTRSLSTTWGSKVFSHRITSAN